MARRSSPLALFEFDAEFSGGGVIAGADEVGRGCLAGPLVTAAVAFDFKRQEPGKLSRKLNGLADSKKLSPAEREKLYPIIMRYASCFSIIIACSRTIDENGLHNTNLKALGQSLDTLGVPLQSALVDGRQGIPGTQIDHVPLIGGDSLSACIAAASVLAKVARDRLMHSLHSFYPQYGFNRHVGYATKEHRNAIKEHGFCSLHRRSFSTAWANGEIPGLKEPSLE